LQISNPLTLLFYRQLKISDANCLDETTILVDTILYLSLYYLVKGFGKFPDPHIKVEEVRVWRENFAFNCVLNEWQKCCCCSGINQSEAVVNCRWELQRAMVNYHCGRTKVNCRWRLL